MSGKKILFVEDEADIRSLVADSLQEAGYEVHLAANGEEGLKAAAAVHPDVIVSDMIMPVKDGNQFFKDLRKTDFGKNIPFIILTARVGMKDYFEVVGADAFLEKPFTMEVLITKIAAILSGEKSAAGAPVPPALGQKFGKVRQEDAPKIVVFADAVDRTKGDMEDVGSTMGMHGVKGKDSKFKKTAFPGIRKKVLIVDQDEEVYNGLQAVLSVYDFETVKAGTFDACLEKARSSFPPDLIILKSVLQGKSAEEFAEQFKQISQIRYIPIIIYDDAREEPGRVSGSGGFKLSEEGKELLKRVRELLR